MFGKASKIRRVARKMGTAHAIYIGDEVRDAEAARAADVAFGAVAWGQNRMELLQDQDPEECFHTPAEIAQKLIAG